MTRRRRWSPPWPTCLALALALASSTALADVLPPGDPGGPSAPAAVSAPAPAVATLAYRVTLDAPTELVETLAASVDLVRWQSYEFMTPDLFERLREQAIGQAGEAAETFGYFSATVSVDVDRTKTPWAVTLHVVPGAATRIASVAITVNGPAADDGGEGAAAVTRIRRDWELPAGTTFSQTLWTDAKARALAILARSPYAAAKIVRSEALIDPAARSAALSIELDSGPAFHLGSIEVSGLKRYSADLVRNYSTLRRGDLYSGAELDQFLRRLNGTGYFASVQATLDADPATAADAPLRLAVIEAPKRNVEVGIGYSTDTRYRFNTSYRDVDFAGRALQFSVDARFESLLQNGTLRVVRPPGEDGWTDTLTLKAERTDLNELLTESAGVGLRRASLDERNQWQYGVAALADRQSPTNGEQSSSRALYVDVERIWRRVDDLVSPTQGWMLDLQLGSGVPGASTRGFVRGVVKSAVWIPLGTRDSFYARLEGGGVAGASRQETPSALLFRTGGDTSVRGYAFDSLGVRDGDAIVPARYFVAGSVEATHWINGSLGVAAFVDAGNAYDRPSDLKLDLGYGVGARVRTPIGPFRLDLAYGQQSRQVRLHFSIGLSF